MTSALFVFLALAAPDPGIEKSRAYAFEWLKQLPDFLCDQSAQRMKGTGSRDDWHLVDTIDTEVSYSGGKERYRLLRRNGSPVTGDKMVGTRSMGSSGEFATALRYLFSPDVSAGFRYKRMEKIRKLRLVRFDYEVKRENSHWSIGIQSMYSPGYAGSVWVEEETGRIHRLTMETRDFPKDFPVRSSFFQLDYQEAVIGGQPFLMPSRSVLQACDRMGLCDRKEITFTNYRKFTAESQLVP
ncbi:hypothetical protein [uncultured Paludibaculum sp.]|uniref:hypothetical protein n=1 Tax=uncultured Paludibaculum sp. TaxID=1765020 RepID=UPI002AAB0FDA|nr:hypothetical protein [uncultured Paludibaculum sp.]